MTTLFPPVIESRAVAIPFSEPSDVENCNYNIEFFVPEVDGPIATSVAETGIKHIQVTLRYKNTGEYAVNTNYSPDGATLFLPTYLTKYVEYNPSTRYCKVKIPYYLFKNRHPDKATNYTAQIRFGVNMLWMHEGLALIEDPYATNRADFVKYGDWLTRQTSTVPSSFGEWSNTQTVYCYGDAKVSLTYNLDDFVPELLYEYSPEEIDPLEQCKIVYNYADINGSVMKSLVFNGVAQSDGSYTLRVKLPIAPVQVIYVSLEAVTVNGTVRGKTLNIPPVIEGAGGALPEVTNPAVMEDLILRGEELEDGVIAKRLLIPFTAWTNAQTLSIYRTNTFSFETIRLKDNIPLVGVTEFRFKDFSVEMGEDYQYIAILKENGIATRQLARIYPWDFTNPAHGRQMILNSTFLDDKNHQLRIQGNVSVSNFKRNTADQFQTTIGSKYPFYSRSAKTDYRTLQLSGVITINLDPTASFLHHDQTDGLRWEDDEGSKLLILNRDIFSDSEYSLSRVRIGKDGMSRQELIEYGAQDESMVRGPASIFDPYFARNQQSKIEPTRSDAMVFMERKFRESVMKWLADGKPKLFRSETEGNMIVMPSAVSFTPLDKTGRIVYTVSMTLTEIAELNLENLIDYDLVPMEIETHSLRNFPAELHIGDTISQADYLALLFYGYEYEDNFIRVGADYQVIDETGLQEILDKISEFSFLRGSPQYPIYDKLTFIKDDDFNIGFILIPEAEEYGWEGPVYKSGEKAGQLHPFIDGVVYANGLDGHTIKFSAVTPLPNGMQLDENTGRLFISIGSCPDEMPPQKLTFKVSDESHNEVYFTISMDSLYIPLEIADDVIMARTTRDNVDLELLTFGGVKFSDISGNPNDISYLFSADGLPYGLSITPDGHIKGRILGKQPYGEFNVWVRDAIGNRAGSTISFNDIYYWPYINQSPSFDVGYLEVGEIYTTKDVTEYLRPYLIDLTEATVGGSGNFTYAEAVAGSLPKGLKIEQKEDDGHWVIRGIIETPDAGKDVPASVVINLFDNEITPVPTPPGPREPNATCTINFGPILPKFSFTDPSVKKVLTQIKGPAEMSGTIPIGWALPSIDILNYTESGAKVKFVTGGLPFYDANGNPYYKFTANNLYPDFKLTTAGILSGRAMVGDEDGRKATLMAMDARGKIIKLEGADDTTIISPITSTLELHTSSVLELPRIKEGDSDAAKYKTTIPVKDVTGGFGNLSIAPDDTSSWPSWLEYGIEGTGDAAVFYVRQRTTGTDEQTKRAISKARNYRMKISDQSYPEQAIFVNLYCGEIVAYLEWVDPATKMTFVPDLKKGTRSVAEIPGIKGGTGPYTFYTKNVDGQPAFDQSDFKFYQGQGTEQDANKFYIAGTPTTDDPVAVDIYVTDGIGQELGPYSFRADGAVEGLNFETKNSMEALCLVANFSKIDSRKIIIGKDGLPNKTEPHYTFRYQNAGEDAVGCLFFKGVTFYGLTGTIDGIPEEVNLRILTIDKDFEVHDSTEYKSFNDGAGSHVWKTPKIYNAPEANTVADVPLTREGTRFTSEPMFLKGIGDVKHPQVKYWYKVDGDYVELLDGDPIIVNGIDTNLIWDEKTTTFGGAISYFDPVTITFKATIAKDPAGVEFNLLQADYEAITTITFKGISKSMSWVRYDPPGKRENTLNWEIPVQVAETVSDISNPYVFEIDLRDISFINSSGVEEKIARIDGGQAPLKFDPDPSVAWPDGWNLFDWKLTHIYYDPDSNPETKVTDIYIVITDNAPGTTQGKIQAKLTWKGVMEKIKIDPTSLSGLAATYRLGASGLTRDITGDPFTVKVSGGSNNINNFKFEFNVPSPYREKFFTNGGIYIPNDSRPLLNMGVDCVKGGTITLSAYDYTIDEKGEAKVSMNIPVGDIVDGLPVQLVDFNFGTNKVKTAKTVTNPIANFFWGSTAFTAAIVEDENYKKWTEATTAKGTFAVNITGTNLVFTYKHPEIAMDAIQLTMRLTSTAGAVSGYTKDIILNIGATTT